MENVQMVACAKMVQIALQIHVVESAIQTHHVLRDVGVMKTGIAYLVKI
jgi:hypothetical protein